MQLVNVVDLESALQQYLDPDNSGQVAEEITAYMPVLRAELAKVPQVTQVLLWDDQEGGDPQLDFAPDLYDRRELIPMSYTLDGGSYYGATFIQRRWYPVGQFIIHLYLGGSPMNSAPGFNLIPVA